MFRKINSEPEQAKRPNPLKHDDDDDELCIGKECEFVPVLN
jgi:hypothetical protein